MQPRVRSVGTWRRAWTPGGVRAGAGRLGPVELPATLLCVARAQHGDPPRGPRRDIRHGRPAPGGPEGGPAAGGGRGEPRTLAATPPASPLKLRMRPGLFAPLTWGPSGWAALRPDLAWKGRASRVRAGGSSSGFITTGSPLRVPGRAGQAFLPGRVRSERLSGGTPPRASSPSAFSVPVGPARSPVGLCERDSQTCAFWKKTLLLGVQGQALLWKSPGVGFIPDLVPGGDGWGFSPRYSP